MNNLVVTVSHDSSIPQLSDYSDIVVLDENWQLQPRVKFDTVYLRSHFSNPDLTPQKFRNEISDIVRMVKANNSAVTFIDNMDDVDTILRFEDKWHQYQKFEAFMPRTLLLSEQTDHSSFVRPVFKQRLSSRSKGVTWNAPHGVSPGNWIIQETLDIIDELRIYAVHGAVMPTAVVRTSKTSTTYTRAVDSRQLTEDEIAFSQKITGTIANLDFIGLDVARVRDGSLMLIEVNRSPGFAKFSELTGIDLASKLYDKSFNSMRVK